MIEKRRRAHRTRAGVSSSFAMSLLGVATKRQRRWRNPTPTRKPSVMPSSARTSAREATSGPSRNALHPPASTPRIDCRSRSTFDKFRMGYPETGTTTLARCAVKDGLALLRAR